MTVRRLKTYTAQTGYVYQYYFVGKRPAVAEAPESPAIEYVFDVTSDRRTFFAVSIFLQNEAVRSWEASRGRELTDTEQYAVGKMALLQCFDEVKDLAASARRFTITPEQIEDLIDALDLG